MFSKDIRVQNQENVVETNYRYIHSDRSKVNQKKDLKS
jgi:hypothetical protein